MKIGFVLISVAPSKEGEVYKALEKLKSNNDEITEFHELHGEYDFIAKLEAKDYNKIDKLAQEIRAYRDNIIDIKTLHVIKPLETESPEPYNK